MGPPNYKQKKQMFNNYILYKKSKSSLRYVEPPPSVFTIRDYYKNRINYTHEYRHLTYNQKEVYNNAIRIVSFKKYKPHDSESEYGRHICMYVRETRNLL